MTRDEINRIRANAVLMKKIADKIAAIEHIIARRGEDFARKKEYDDLVKSFNLLAANDKRLELIELINKSDLTPTQKTTFFDYYISGKQCKKIAETINYSESNIFYQLKTARKLLNIIGDNKTGRGC